MQHDASNLHMRLKDLSRDARVDRVVADEIASEVMFPDADAGNCFLGTMTVRVSDLNNRGRRARFWSLGGGLLSHVCPCTFQWRKTENLAPPGIACFPFSNSVAEVTLVPNEGSHPRLDIPAHL